MGRILFVRSDAYGDLILFAPVLRAAIEAFGANNVGLMIRSHFADIAPVLPSGVRTLFVDVDPYRQGPADTEEKVARAVRDAGEFGATMVCIPALDETWLDVAVAGAQTGARRLKHGRFYTQSAHAVDVIDLLEPMWKEFDIIPVRGETESQRNWAFGVAAFGAPAQRRADPSCRVPEDAALRIKSWLAAEGLRPKQFAVVFPGGGRNVSIKQWPPERFAAVVRHLRERHGLAVVVAGAADDQATLDKVKNLCGRGETVLWRGNSGEFPLLAALLQVACLFVGNDTGPLHLASSVGTPAVGVYGGGHWPRFIPSMTHSVAIAHPLPCFGCNWDCLLGSPLCVQLVDTTSVCKGVDQALAGEVVSQQVQLSGGVPNDALRLIDNAAKHRLRSEAESARRTSAAIAWAREERTSANSVRAQLEAAVKHRADIHVWAEQEKLLRERAEQLLKEAEADRDGLRVWAEQEKLLRERAEQLLKEAEADRDGLRVWAEQEKLLRQNMQRSLEISEENRQQTTTLLDAARRTVSELDARLSALADELSSSSLTNMRLREELGALSQQLIAEQTARLEAEARLFVNRLKRLKCRIIKKFKES